MSSDRHYSRKSNSRQPLKRFMQSLLRLLFRLTGRRTPQAGFVFPTTLLLVLMVLLTVSALTYRTFTRSTQVIGQREQQVIYNSATPAIDRAKAKLEFLFREDDRYPTATPNSDFLANMMLPETDRLPGGVVTGETLQPLAGITDAYTLPDETRLDLNGDGKRDNAWSFKTDINGDGTAEDEEIAVYSILVDHQAPDPSGGSDIDVQAQVTNEKAQALVTRTGPLATTLAGSECPNAAAVDLEGGWTEAQGNIQKNFQVNVFVANSNPANQAFETLEFQQSRIASRANKWGAWFRYDLGIFPGADFKWNGAMHTDGSLIVAREITSYMVTSHNSCIYTEDASEITLGEVTADANAGIEAFQGQAIKGQLKDNNFSGGNVEFHLFDGRGQEPILGTFLTEGNHSIAGAGRPADVAMNPIALFLEDKTEHINPDNWNRRDGWDDSDFVQQKRIRNDETARPYVDDFFRADNRWGPKPRYDSRDLNVSLDRGTVDPADDNTVGQNIDPATYAKLINAEDGLDGYWERQAVRSGLRLIVGERFELGNTNGWGYDPSDGTATGPAVGDPLYPPQAQKTTLTANTQISGDHQYRQHKALRDNLAAVQSMAVYHYDLGGDFPAACMALTAHPGTEAAIINSRKFRSWDDYTEPAIGANAPLRTDFLTGNGTNGWEFQYPDTFDTGAEFAGAIASGQPLGTALRNLVRFAGDPNGGAPSFPPVQDANIHPYPLMSMWGDFSIARRIVDEQLDGTPAVAYSALSPADQSTLHTAACTLSMLAYNLNALEAIKEQVYETATLEKLGETIYELVDGVYDDTTEVVNGISIKINPEIAVIVGEEPEYEGEYGNTYTITIGDRDGDGNIGDPGDLIDLNTNQVRNNGVNGVDPTYYQNNIFTSEELLLAALVELNGGNFGNDIPLASINYASTLSEALQARRDRIWGFKDGGLVPLSTETAINDYGWDPNVNNVATIGTASHKLYCDPDVFSAVPTGAVDRANKKIGLAMALCSDLPKYPALYYVFPYSAHEQDGESDTGASLNASTDLTFEPAVTVNHDQSAEEYGGDTYITTTNGSTEIYGVVDPSAIAGEPGLTTPASWVIPATAASASTELTDPNATDQAFRIQIGADTASDVAFLDKGMFNGREQLAIRVLDIDIDALTTQTVPGGTNGDFWLTAKPDDPAIDTDFATEGIVYAFREDAVREDEIVRPANAGAANCDGKAGGNPVRFNIETVNACKMIVRPGGGTPVVQDPPLQKNDVSIKPVDFLPDPDRRPHGFRFKTASGDPADFRGDTVSSRDFGMTFVTDNAAYIQGDFNLHSTDGTRANFVEEFTDTLQNRPNFNPGNFYNDREADELNLETFADPNVDHWRPVEILADALSILSLGYEDGDIDDAFQGNNSTDSSYAALNRPRNNGPWLREDPGVDTSPIWVDRNGTFYIKPNNQPANEYYDVLTNDNQFISMEENGDRWNNINDATPTYVNAVFVSGIVPERPNQSYGGLHNYPRFLEDWSGQELFISGSFIQLSFSTSATGPFDQDAWEPDDATIPGDVGEYYYHYQPPNRRWGFDVGLLYVPPAPAARRFNQIGQERSEYYREVPSDDPYTENLKCATDNGTKVFPQFCPQ
ncbi:hormogonium polysaccharide biosynthesis protein HpsA [Oscillatoria sp. CS-180]|uniref:hormogonium polysaccharide biosynthesis protein HpsA n=1 Tax=Oscillatoria sp. CS-180 TaxID=3021720 RepID=UPI0023312110|nr:hormogonium polysaccharide biosynthesis protein HpsA [Oscillatoria sp. CS-180]MDB9527761.1 hormogonium polysaccharide biosynthesis protein HpsA [Oscillatoria sp. CS-180]